MSMDLFSFKELYECFLKITYPLEVAGRQYEVGEVIAKFDKIQIAADTGITSFGQLKIAGGGGKGFVYTTFGLGNDTQVVLNGVPSTVLDATDFIFTA